MEVKNIHNPKETTYLGKVQGCITGWLRSLTRPKKNTKWDYIVPFIFVSIAYIFITKAFAAGYTIEVIENSHPAYNTVLPSEIDWMIFYRSIPINFAIMVMATLLIERPYRPVLLLIAPFLGLIFYFISLNAGVDKFLIIFIYKSFTFSSFWYSTGTLIVASRYMLIQDDSNEKMKRLWAIFGIFYGLSAVTTFTQAQIPLLNPPIGLYNWDNIEVNYLPLIIARILEGLAYVSYVVIVGVSMLFLEKIFGVEFFNDSSTTGYYPINSEFVLASIILLVYLILNAFLWSKILGFLGTFPPKAIEKYKGGKIR